MTRTLWPCDGLYLKHIMTISTRLRSIEVKKEHVPQWSEMFRLNLILWESFNPIMRSRTLCHPRTPTLMKLSDCWNNGTKEILDQHTTNFYLRDRANGQTLNVSLDFKEGTGVQVLLMDKYADKILREFALSSGKRRIAIKEFTLATTSRRVSGILLSGSSVVTQIMS